ncbi:glycoside hydrolase family 30 protein [Vibrio sp. WXL103]|uniref:glycoside hydrolase family 30 protein n=1 Tax=Vibrio sp. WXL103 TaxID=3450710 RepID=UPI003EC6678B
MKWFVSTENEKWKQRTIPKSGLYGEPDCTLELGSRRDQTMLGFGGCFNELGYIALEKLGTTAQSELQQLLFDPHGEGLRFNFCRLPIGASDYAASWYSHNENEDDFDMECFSIARDEKYLLPYIHWAKAINPELELFASPWSPPTWMKFPQAYNYGRLRMEPDYLTAYAHYFVRFVEEYRQQGIDIAQIHVQNEPMSSQKFPSCVITGEEFATFIGDYLGPAFDASNITSEIWLGTLNGPETDERKFSSNYHNYANLVLHDPKALKYIKGVSYQWAGKYAMKQTRDSWPSLNLIQSENECGDGQNSWEYARYVFDLFQHYLTHGAYAYIYWNMILENEGESTWGWKQNSLVVVDPENQGYELTHEFYVMKHFSRYVAKGARRIDLSGSYTANSVAFENPDSSIVIVTFNPFDRAMAIQVNVNEKPMQFELPSDSINTFVLD